jgi:hypothetical protein
MDMVGDISVRDSNEVIAANLIAGYGAFQTMGLSGHLAQAGSDGNNAGGDLPTDVLVSEARSRQIEGLWLREPGQFLFDALPRARSFLDKFGDIGRRLNQPASLVSASASCTSRGAG